VFSQTYLNYEVIIVNDGSTDKSLEIVNQFNHYHNIKIFTQDNQGVSVARNRGIKESQFKYIAFLDGDDEWLPNFLLKIKEAIKEYPDSAMFGTSSLHTNFETKNSTDSTIFKFRNKVVKIDCFSEPNLLPHTSAIVVKKSILYNLDNDLNVFPIGMKVCEDWACFHRIALNDNIIYIGIPLAIRNNNIIGQITGNKENSEEILYDLWLDGIRYYNLVYKYWLNTKSNKNFISYVNYNLRHSLKQFLMNKNWKVIDLLVLGLDKGLLSSFERKLYNKKMIRNFSILFINLSKINRKISLWIL
jgi:glycosyltransferase involved in cell wall biosynthesis